MNEYSFVLEEDNGLMLLYSLDKDEYTNFIDIIILINNELYFKNLTTDHDYLYKGSPYYELSETKLKEMYMDVKKKSNLKKKIG